MHLSHMSSQRAHGSGRTALWPRRTLPSQRRILLPLWATLWKRRWRVMLYLLFFKSVSNLALNFITLLYTKLLRIFFFLFSPHFKGVVSQGWQADANTRMVMPKKPGRWQCCSVKLRPGCTQKEHPTPRLLLPGDFIRHIKMLWAQI